MKPPPTAYGWGHVRRSGVITETARTGPSSSTDWTDPNNRSDNGRRPRNERPAAPCRPRRLDAAAFVAVAADTDRHPTVKSQFRRRLPVPPTAAPFPFLPPPPKSVFHFFSVSALYSEMEKKKTELRSIVGRSFSDSTRSFHPFCVGPHKTWACY